MTAEPPPVDEVMDAYSIWEADKMNQANLAQVVRTLKPTINAAVAGVSKGKNSPLLAAHGNLLATQAVTSFDPTKGTNLRSHVTNQLQGLRRINRKLQFPIDIPDRVQLDNFTLHKARESMREELGREPDMVELADRTGISTKRQRKLTPYNLAMTSQENSAPEKIATDYHDEALDYVLHDSDYLDRKIIEMRAHGTDNKVLAGELGIDAATLSRRLMRIAQRVAKIEGDLKQVYATE